MCKLSRRIFLHRMKAAAVAVGAPLVCSGWASSAFASDALGKSTGNPALGNWKPFKKPSRGFDPRKNLDLVPNAEFTIGKDRYGPVVRVNMLKIKDWPAVPGIKKAWKAHYLTAGPEDTFSNLILSEVIDVDGRGTFHAFCYIDWYKSHIARYDDKGRCLWVSDRLPRRAGDESRLPVLDVDGTVRSK